MPIPTEPVGSLPRPAKLQAAYADYDAGKIGRQELEREQDAACLDSIKRMEATGSPIVSDGEQRASSFATYPITDTLAGTGLAANLAGRRPVLRDLHRRPSSPAAAPDRRPVQVQDLRRRLSREVDQDGVQADEAGGHRAVDAGAALSARRARSRATRASSSCPISATNARRTSARRSRPARERVSIDFTEGRLACRNDPEEPVDRPRHARATSSSSTTACSTASRPRSAGTSASTPVPAATATRPTAPMSTTPTSCPACSR